MYIFLLTFNWLFIFCNPFCVFQSFFLLKYLSRCLQINSFSVIVLSHNVTIEGDLYNYFGNNKTYFPNNK